MSDPEVVPLAESAPAPVSRIDAALAKWIGFVEAHPVPVHVLVAATLTAIVDLIIVTTRASLPPTLTSVGLEVIIVLASLFVPAIITAVALRREFRVMLQVVDDGPPAAAPVLLRFIREELADLQEQVEDLRTQGALLSQAQVSEWVRRRCFQVTRGRYIASDSCVPSQFVKRYAQYLRAHKEYLARTKDTQSVRINVASDQDLAADRKGDPAAFSAYVNWHMRHDVTLLHLDYHAALRTARQHQLGDVVDWAFWLGELGLSWHYETDGVRMRLTFVGETAYRRAYDYLREVIEEAKLFTNLPILREVGHSGGSERQEQLSGQHGQATDSYGNPGSS